jgi:hypothetical protein
VDLEVDEGNTFFHLEAVAICGRLAVGSETGDRVGLDLGVATRNSG